MIGSRHISCVNSNRTSLWEQAEFPTSCYIKRWKERHFETLVCIVLWRCLTTHCTACVCVSLCDSCDEFWQQTELIVLSVVQTSTSLPLSLHYELVCKTTRSYIQSYVIWYVSSCTLICQY